MSNAARDENNVPTLVAVLDADGTTVMRLKTNPTTHAVDIADDTTGSDNGPINAARDDNYVTTLIGVSSVDGVTPVPIYADANGNLLVDSN